MEGGGRWWRPLIEFENRVEYRSRANWRWCTESVRRNFHSVKSLCIVEIAALRCVEFFSFFFPFFSLFFFSHLSSTSALLSRLSIVAPLLVEEEEEEEEDVHVRTRGRRETRHWASDFAADFTRKSFFDFGPQRLYKRRRSSPDSQLGRVI